MASKKKKEEGTPFDLYEYVWHDHSYQSGWQYDLSRDKYLVHSVGYLMSEDKDHYYFTNGLVPLSGAMHGLMSVVKSALVTKSKIKTTYL